ncbi:unnamed protein product, partial [Ilex paraguariensis]
CYSKIRADEIISNSKSKAHIYELKEKTKSLQDKASFLESEYKGLLESKKCLEFNL